MPKKIFLSHKARDKDVAREFVKILRQAMENVEFKLSEEIGKGSNWVSWILREATQSDYLILLYTDQSEDWSWCLYETGLFAGLHEGNIYLLHHPDEKGPSPLATLQDVKVAPEDVIKWLREFFVATNQSAALDKIQDTCSAICNLLTDYSPELVHSPLKPCITISPKWPITESGGKQQRPHWTAGDLPSDLGLERARIKVDLTSAILLGFSNADQAEALSLGEFLRTLDCENEPAAIWIEKFLRELDRAIRLPVFSQQIAYFRHESGKIYRPIIEKVSRSKDGRCCECRVLFAEAFNPPLQASDPAQALSNGIRLATRIRTEVIAPYRRRMAEIWRKKMHSHDPRDQIASQYPVGARLSEALDLIMQEATANGYRPQEEAPKIFVGDNQKTYAELRDKFPLLVAEIRAATRKEDSAGNGVYSDTEACLERLSEMISLYFSIAVPQFQALLPTLA